MRTFVEERVDRLNAELRQARDEAFLRPRAAALSVAAKKACSRL
jgi:hypothetical protein